MTKIKLKISCANCDEDIVMTVLDFTGEGIVDIDFMIDGEVFDCTSCGQSTSVLIDKESF